MTDIEEKYRERWQDKRKKTYDWKRLVIMILATFAIFILIDRLNKVGQSQAPATEFTAPDSAAAPQTPNLPEPGATP
ncbi:MAG: hypothetical protein PHD87_00270 [Candidatus Cloacimonetes bacterium]|jgi:hypothetical protein|nr:hypothetical protein [Candidatus Cloacimonadota bacterium]MDD4223007.1 hypothetical protein [Candidatus Cloacimonadota bacterium]